MLAYVDPGVGALAWQMVISALVGLFFYLRKTRNWVVKTFLRFFQSK
jgi:NADH:ubiquinone oxidoreductase subunit 2 (subunit N)